MQSAYIAGTYGKGPEECLEWVGNGLFGPGHIPTKEAVKDMNANEWYRVNQMEVFDQGKVN